MNISQEYNRDYEPPAPYLDIYVLSVEGDYPEEPISALLDSGADATMLPLTSLQRVNAPYLERMLMRWGESQPELVDIYVATVRIGHHIIFGVNVIAMPPGSEAILGRDVLNQFEINLDGLALETTIISN